MLFIVGNVQIPVEVWNTNVWFHNIYIAVRIGWVLFICMALFPITFVTNCSVPWHSTRLHFLTSICALFSLIHTLSIDQLFTSGTSANPDGWAVWGVVVSTRWWLLVDHCVLRNWDRILVRAVKGLISRAGMVSICPLLWQRDVKLQQTKHREHH